MPPATLAPMGKKKRPEKPRPTAVVRVEADIARMVSIISTATGEDVADILSPLIRPAVEARYAEVVRKLGDEIQR